MKSRLFLCTLVGSLALAQQTPSSDHHLFFRVTLAPQVADTLQQPVRGRLIVLLSPGTGKKEITVGFEPASTWLAAREVDGLKPGESVEVDADESAYPEGFSHLKPGDYQAEAFLDLNHSFAYTGPAAGDVTGAPVTLTNFNASSAAPVALSIDHVIPEKPTPELPTGVVAEKFLSPSLTQFWGRPTYINAAVALPPDYDSSKDTYPTVYWTHGFGGTLAYVDTRAITVRHLMEAKQIPSMIQVCLDESFPPGTHEFADSVNNGPWGHALTAEFIPYLEQKYRMDARPSGRFLTGHSSGGWATLWLQVAYPRIFGGTWSTSPDPSDFHSFTGPDIYAVHANVYHKPDGSPWMLVRMGGKDVASVEEFAKQEAVEGPYGGQMSSFDWVFSPKSDSGAPMPMFDRVTGNVDPAVAKYWGEHYDVANKVEREWPQNAEVLRGKIHLIVGTADTFHLDEAARLLQARLERLGADAHFSYLPGKTHFDLYEANGDRRALDKKIADEMYAVARPNSKALNTKGTR